MTKQRLLVTGHTGFIGRAVSARLQENGADWQGVSGRAGFALERAESLDEVSVCDLIIHLAGITDVADSWQRPAYFLRTNYLTTLTALEFARKHNAAMLFVSSYMYGRPHILPIDEAHPVSLENPYAASKHAGEELCRFYAERFSIPVSILRPFNIFGEGQPNHALIPHVLRQALSTNEINVKDLAPKRDYLYLEDFVNAIMSLVNCPPPAFEIYNIGTGRSHSVREVIETVGEILGVKLKINCAEEPRPNEIDDCYADISKFAGGYNWRPTYSLREGLERIIAAMPARQAS